MINIDEIEEQLAEASSLIDDAKQEIKKDQDVHMKSVESDFCAMRHLSTIDNIADAIKITIDCLRELSREK